LRLNEHLAHDGESVFWHACALGCEDIVSKRLGSTYRSGRSKDWLKFKNPEAPDGESIVEHVAGVEDYQLALATFRVACERWPNVRITLRQGARVIEDSRHLRLAWSDKGRQGGR
jgi:hypothetical protein